MKGIIVRSLGLTIVLAAGAVSLTAGDAAKPAKTGIPLVTDWSSRHVIFSHPRTPEQAARIQKDIRYQMQLHRQDSRAVVADQVDEYAATHFRHHPRRRRGRRMHRDWSWDLGSGASVGASNFPAKYSFSSSVATCVGSAKPDFVVYGTGLPGSVGAQGDIIALTNLYAGCGGQVPGTYWSYNTGGTVNTSPVFSFDGTQLAFTQTNGTSASLVLLKWSGFDGLVQNPAMDLATAVPSGYLACAAPCMTSFSLGVNDTGSSVYYDYFSDTAWVGDDSGKLHEYTGIFKGTPTEIMSGGWPASVSSKKLTGAVYNASTGVTYVGDSGGILYSVTSAGFVTASGRLDYGLGLTESPILDASAGSLYAFSSNDNTGFAGVFQLSTGFTSGSIGTEVKIGTASVTTPQYDGAFDHDYIYSTNTTGNLYACGNPGGEPTLYQIPISTGMMGAVKTGPIISTTGTTPCSPLIDVYNSIETGSGLPQEWVFLSTRAAATPVGCGAHSCIMNFKVTQWQPSFTYNVGQEILDSNLNIQVCESSNTISGATPPAWSTGLFSKTSDNLVHWRNQGPVQAFPPPADWTSNTSYDLGAEIIDGNNNMEIVYNLGGGTSGLTPPTWMMVEGQQTTDNDIIWYNLGANPVAGLPAPGGTSGIIIDNTINNPGGSQVYFSNLQDTGCATSGGTGGCAIQASQTVLH
ncbi:MAG: hypothetical protein WAM79_16925 [Candidatus Sulfotelmatobacter sp.]